MFQLDRMVSQPHRFVLLLLSLLCLAVMLPGSHAAGKMVWVQENALDQYLNTDWTFVTFFAPGCKECQGLEEALESTAASLKPGVILASVNCLTNTLCATHHITIQPTTLIFRRGKLFSTHVGPDVRRKILPWATRYSSPPTRTLGTRDEFNAILKDARSFVVVGYFASAEQEGAQAFLDAARSRDTETEFGIIVSDELAQSLSFSVMPSVRIYNRHTRKVEDQVNMTDLEEWIAANTLPILDDINPATFYRKAHSGRALAVWFFDYSDAAKLEDNLLLARGVARRLSHSMHFVYTDLGTHKDRLLRLGGTGTKSPSLVVDFIPRKKHYAFHEDWTMSPEFIIPWLEDVLSGKAEPAMVEEKKVPGHAFRKDESTAPVTKNKEASTSTPSAAQEPAISLHEQRPHHQNQAAALRRVAEDASQPEEENPNVVELTARTFDHFLSETPQSVLVMFYAPWCQHSQAFDPIYSHLARLSTWPNLVFAKIDADRYTVETELFGYPTIKLYARGRKDDPILFQQLKTSDALSAFLTKWIRFTEDSFTSAQKPGQERRQMGRVRVTPRRRLPEGMEQDIM